MNTEREHEARQARGDHYFNWCADHGYEAGTPDAWNAFQEAEQAAEEDYMEEARSR